MQPALGLKLVWCALMLAPLGGCASSAPAQSPAPQPSPPAPRGTPTASSPASQSASGSSVGKARVVETRTPEVIQQHVHDRRQGFRDCYEAFLVGHPAIAVDITVRFLIGPKGDVKSAEVVDDASTIDNPELTSCLIERVRQLQFPASSRGSESKVNYPFNFNP